MRTSYRSLLADVLPFALIGAGENADALYLMQRADCALRAPQERQKVMMQKQYAADPEKVKRRTAEYRKANPTASKRRERYQVAHGYKIMKGREYAKERAETGKAQAYREGRRDEQRAWAKARSSAAGDDYAREQLAKGSPLSAKDFPQALVELKKVAIKLTRSTK